MNWNTAAFAAFPYEITDKNIFWSEHPEFDKKSGQEFSKLCRQAFDDGKPNARDIRQCIARWPDVPGFQWMLAECLSYDDEDEMDLVLDALLEKHPDSIFSIITRLTRVVTHEEEPPTYWGMEDALELDELFPERTVFHVLEVFLYESASFMVSFDQSGGHVNRGRHARYTAMLTSLVHANQLAALSEIIYQKHPQIQGSSDGDEVDDLDEDDALLDEWIEESMERSEKRLDALQTTEKPCFLLGMTEDLYRPADEIKVQQILAFLKQVNAAVITDMEQVLYDSVARLFYFEDEKIEQDAPMHALILLCHFQSLQSAPAIIHFLSQPDEVLDPYLGDVLTEHVFTWLALILKVDLQAFDALLLDVDADVYARNAVLSGLEQVGFHWPEKLPEIEGHLLAILELMNTPDRKDISLLELNAEFAYVATTLKLKRLLSATQPLYAAGRASVWVQGNWSQVLRYMRQPTDPRFIKNLHEGDLEGMYSELSWIG